MMLDGTNYFYIHISLYNPTELTTVTLLRDLPLVPTSH